MEKCGLFTSEIDIIYNGTVVYIHTVVNSAYLEYKNLYSADVFKIISSFNAALIEYDEETFQYTTGLSYLLQNWPLNQ